MLLTRPTRLGALLLISCLTVAGPWVSGAPGAEPDDPAANGPSETATQKQEDRDDASDLSVIEHETQIDGRPLHYTTTTGTLPLRDDDGKVEARVFFMAYTIDADPAARPVTFCFNGGPGSSSVWLHLGAFGPQRVRMTDRGEPDGPPFALIDNPHTLLPATDLVFIDPVSTGFSRAEEGVDPRRFHGVTEDIKSVAEFVRLYTTKFGRWPSPKFLAGESYGTTRAAGLASHLQAAHGMFLNGLVLVSVVLDFQTLRFDGDNDLAFVLALPTYAATAWYHQRLAAGLQQRPLPDLMAEVSAFAGGDYLAALYQGSRLTPEACDRIAERLAAYTSLPKTWIKGADLRILPDHFRKRLLHDERRVVGRFDSRLTGYDSAPPRDVPEFDPSFAAVQGGYTAALNHHVRETLGYENDRKYEILSRQVHPWTFDRAQNRYLNVAADMRKAMTRNSALHVFVASGYYDLATPFLATEYTLSHLTLPAASRTRIHMAYYEAGHMMYTHRRSQEKLNRDIEVFMRKALERRP